MPGRDLTNGVMTARTVWHSMEDAAGQAGGTTDLALFNGTVLYANGESALYAGVEAIDMSGEREPFSGNRTVLLSDGSVSTQSFTGEVTFREAAGRFGGSGRWKQESGTGRFAGLTGGGVFTWSVDGETYREEFSG